MNFMSRENWHKFTLQFTKHYDILDKNILEEKVKWSYVTKAQEATARQ